MAQEACSGGGYNPTPTPVEVEAVPIIVESTVDDYFVLYVLHDLGNTVVEVPVLVALGGNGTTSLAENIPMFSKERYAVEKFQIATPADIDGDCVDDITELDNPVGMNPLSANPRNPNAIDLIDGAMSIPDRETFEALSNQWYVKFVVVGLETGDSHIYFSNTSTYTDHWSFLRAIDVEWDSNWRAHGALSFDPNAVAPDGSLGVYRADIQPHHTWPFDVIDIIHTKLAASTPLVDDNLAYYVQRLSIGHYQYSAESFETSRINVLVEDDLVADVGFIPLNPAEGYGLLRVMDPGEQPGPRDVVIYETIPNEVSRVAGIITTAPQTPLSHVNLRAIQDGVPNAFIRNALNKTPIADLIGGYVHYTVSESGWEMRAATLAEVNAHHASSRPTAEQIPQRDLSVTSITPLGEIGFEDWDAFGVKAANVAVLGSLGFPNGTVPDGVAIPFHFYDSFMESNEIYDRIDTMLADPDFQTDIATQEEELKELRKAIRDADTPTWIVTALEDMHGEFPEDASLRYRSSTNNEDLPGFNGAGLYDSKTQKPDETAEDGIDKSLKEVYASMWNLRAFIERDFYRVNHTMAAMGVLVHPNYSDELANGVAVSFDPLDGDRDTYYINTQIGEDLVTNPEALSIPEEIKLAKTGSRVVVLIDMDPESAEGNTVDYLTIPLYNVISTSNHMPPWTLLLSNDQLNQMRTHLAAIHDKFEDLYGVEPGEEFAMEIEFKITSDDILAIKQARPWVFEYERLQLLVPTLSTASASPTNATTIQVAVDFGEAINATTFADSDISVTGGNVTGLAHQSGNTFTFTLTPSDDGEVTASVPANMVEDSSGNGNAASNALSVTFDRTDPVITLAGAVQVSVATGSTYSDPGATCADDIAGNLTGTMTTSSDVDTGTTGQYSFTYTCADGAGNSAQESRAVTVVDNDPPAADAGADQTVSEGDTVALSGTASDNDDNSLTYQWTHDSGLPIGLADDAVLSTTFTAPAVPVDTAITFTLTVSDGLNDDVTDQVEITVTDNDPPAADAGADQTIHEGVAVTLAGTASGFNNGTLTYLWSHDSQLNVTIADAAAISTTFTAPQVSSDTAITFTLTVSDDTDTSTGQVAITVIDIPSASFATNWQTTTPNERITIPVGGTTGTYTVYWGDGATSADVQGDQSHVYENPGTYKVSISGNFTRIFLPDSDPANARKLMSIEQWGDTRWTSMKSAFEGASSMTYRATDTPNLSSVTDMNDMFREASSFNGDISSWDVSSVTDMNDMFREASSFNQPLDSWNVSSVTDMNDMFREASSFNQSLDSWDVSSVTDMNDMFREASSFNGDISSWDVSSATDTDSMFREASSFNGDISSWNVSSVTDMNDMFREASSFNQPLDSWNVSSVTDMNDMFREASSFNQPLDSWNVSSVTDMNDMFRDALAFEQNLGNWHAVLDDTSINYDHAPGTVGTISAQNSFLDGQNPVYGIGSGGDSDSFELIDSSLVLKVVPTKDSYVVTVTATSTGDFGTGNSRTFDIGISGFTDNAPPSVDAGQNQTADEGDTVTLSGTASDSNDDSLTYSWTHDSSLAIQLANSTSPSTTFTAPAVDADTEITFTLTADDGTATASDQVIVTIDHNDPPAVSAGPDQAAQEGSAVTLSGTATDDDGDPLTYMWRHDSTRAIQLANSTSPSTTFTAPAVDADTEITFTLTADDGTATAADSLVVTVTDVPAVNSLPVADAGLDQVVQEGQAVTLNGTATDDDGDDLTYAWSHDSILEMAFNASMPAATFVAPPVDADTTVTFTLAVSDGSANSTDTVLVTVRDMSGDSDFVTTWETTAPGESITIPTRGKYTIDWGDGTVDANVRHSQTHVYDTPGNHTVRISKGITVINLNNHADAPKLQSIDQWGEAKWRSMQSSFKGASNMVLHATDAPNLSRTADMSYMFMHAGSFDGDLSGWDVSGVTDMTGMFYNANSFNGNLSSWDVSGATDMTGMFYGASSFDGDLSGWDVSGVTDMNGMFSGASSFDGDLSGWDVSHVTDMYSMFSGARSFDGDLSGWDVSGVTDMNGMFATARSFDGDLSGWDVSGATDMTRMFHNADSFEQNLGPWYIVLDDAVIDRNDIPGEVGRIAAQNSFLDGQNPAYRIDSGGDSAHFELDGGTLRMTSVPDGHEGPYSVTITSTKGFGAGNSRTFDIGISGFTDNAPPSVDAGQNQTADEGDTVILSGTASDSNDDSLTYSWSHDSSLAIQLANSTSPSTTFIAPAVDADTEITFTLTADDGTATAADSLVVTVTDVPAVNSLPVADAGSDQTAQEGSAVTLSGTATDDDDDSLTYSWSHDSSLAIQLANSTSPSTTFTAPEVDADTEITFTLTADDGTATASDQVIVTIDHNDPPAVSAGPDQAVQEGSAVTLSGTVTNIDSSLLTYTWTHDSSLDIPFNATSPVITFVAPQVSTNTTITFVLAADYDGSTYSDSIILNVTDIPDTITPAAFVTTWKTSADGESITIPTGGTAGSYTVDWGDGTTATTHAGDATHAYSDAGTYTVSISGDFARIKLGGDRTNAAKLQSIEQWGGIQWESMDNAFKGASNMTYNAIDTPDLSGVTSMNRMFAGASSFDGNLSGWNVSSVTDMARTFRGTSSFGGDISGWNVSRVTDMSSMLEFAAAFNGNISGWDVSRVTDMAHMFYNATDFNGNISGWDVSRVTDTGNMFRNAASFNGDLGNWDVSAVVDMSRMFKGASAFNGNVSGWNTVSATNMHEMFYNAAAFNWNVSGWDVSGVTTMTNMFNGADAFAQNLGNWHIVLDSTSIDYDDAPGTVGDISAQNSFLDGLGPTYGIGSGAGSDAFELDGSNLVLKVVPTKDSYAVTVTATSTGDFGTGNSRTFDIGISGFTDNAPPSVDAGQNQTANEGDTVILSGTASDSNDDSLTYSWTHDSSLAIQLANSTSPSTTFTAPEVDADTEITFTLTADDGTATASGQVIITINYNDPPAVSAGPDQAAQEGSAVTLSGTATDDDGDSLTYSWTHDSSLAIQLANSTSPSTTFTAPEVDADTEITFTLTADDGTATAADSLVVTVTDVPVVNSLPVADAGLDQAVQEGQAVTLNGTATDTDGDDLMYTWSHDSTMEMAFNASLPAATFVAPPVDADTTVTFTLTVSDGSANSTDTVLVTVSDVPGDSDFVTTWETTAPGESITIPARGKYTIDWGDGTVDANVRHSQTHEYDTPGNHTVRISKGITVINLNNHADAPKLQSIDQWGETKWRSMQSSFKGASNMVLHATDAPNLVRTDDMSYMFMHAGSFDGDLSGWDVSGVTDMTGMFYNANSFNGSLSGWDVSGVTDMTGMFYNVHSFNGNISGWDVSRVTDMTGMFYNVHSFNGDLSGWDVSGVTDMSSMFSGASSFDGNISAWDVSSVTDMNGMFATANSFNGNISGWDVSGTTDMTRMFHNADSFEQNLGPWYIVLDDAAIDSSDIPGEVGRIAAQNSFLDGQNPAYGIGSGGDSAHFELDGGILRMTSVPDGHEGPYLVTITSTKGFGTGNSRTFDISVTGGTGNTPPPVPSDPREIGGITVSSTQPGTIQIAWDAPSEQPREYRVTWAKSGENFPNWRDTVGNAFPTSTSQTVSGLEEGEEYQIKVRARYDSGGPGDWSDVITVTVAGTQ